MMDLPLAMLAAPTTRSGGGSASTSASASSSGERDSFGAVLSSLLGEAEQEVADMVETLESLAEADAETRDALTTVGWPLPDLLALATDGEVELPSDPGDGSLLAELAAGDAVGDDPTAEELEAAVLREGAHLLAQLAALRGEVEDADLPPLSTLRPTVEGDPEETAEEGDGDVSLGRAPATEDGLARTSRATGSATDTARGVQAATEPAPDTEPTVEETERALETGPARASSDAEAARDRAIGAARAAAVDAATRSSSETARFDGAAPVSEPAEAPSATSNRPTVSRPPAMSLAMQRVLEAVERLELMPPPRALTVDLGEHRLRVALEDGQLRLTLLDGDQGSGDEFLRDARDELAAQGFDLGEGGDPSADASPERDDDPTATPRTARRSSVPSGLRL